MKRLSTSEEEFWEEKVIETLLNFKIQFDIKFHFL
jgi:hypothetical protein